MRVKFDSVACDTARCMVAADTAAGGTIRMSWIGMLWMLGTASSFSLVSDALLMNARSLSLTEPRPSAATSARRDLILVWNKLFPDSLGFSRESNIKAAASLSTEAPFILARYCVFSSPALRAGIGTGGSWKITMLTYGGRKQIERCYHLFAVDPRLHRHPVETFWLLALCAFFTLHLRERRHARHALATSTFFLLRSFLGGGGSCGSSEHGISALISISTDLNNHLLIIRGVQTNAVFSAVAVWAAFTVHAPSFLDESTGTHLAKRQLDKSANAAAPDDSQSQNREYSQSRTTLASLTSTWQLLRRRPVAAATATVQTQKWN
jgi:hypothetical protein